MEPIAAPAVCRNCGQAVAFDDLACRACGALVHRDELERLSLQASALEQSNPTAAAAAWRRCLELLPPNSQQHQMIAQRLSALQSRPGSARPRDDSLGKAVLKTAGSMLLSIVVYYYYGRRDWGFAAGFVFLILIHEMGHVIANRYYGLHASPPIFIPFLGAVINLRESPKNAKVEAVIGIAGPVSGTIGALACYAYALHTGNSMAMFLAHIAFFLNLFNLLPVPPLDGGRVAAAISPWVWILGLLGMGALAADDLMHGQDVSILVLIVVIALPRIILTLQSGGRSGPYYQITRRATWTIATSYLLLLALLGICYYITNRMVRPLL